MPPATDADADADTAPHSTVQVVIHGTRASLMSALRRKRDAAGVVDVVEADDIHRLPDLSVSDALQRVTGVQIARDRGEGGVVTVRGLTQTETLLNGREVFSAGTGRTLDFADIPSEMLAGIEVWKTTPSDQIEGGLGGTINLRTHRPFDFAGDETVLSARLLHGDLAKQTEPQFSVLASRRWHSERLGELGLLVDLAHQQRAFREDSKGTASPVARSDLIAGQTVMAPSGTSETISQGERRRTAGSLVLAWRPTRALALYAEGHLAELHTRQDSQQMNVLAPVTPSFEPGSLSLFPGSQDLQRITWTNASFSVLSFARDTVDRSRQVALGGSWSNEHWRLSSDLSHTDSHNQLFFSGPFMAGTAARFTHDLSGSVPGSQLSGTNLQDPATYRFTGIAYRERPFDGKLSAWRFDAERDLDHPNLTAIALGARVAHRNADNGSGLIFGDASVSGLTGADRPDFLRPGFGDFLAGSAAPSVNGFLVGDLGLARDPAALRSAFGITAALPQAGSPLGLWRIDEHTDAAYLLARFRARSTPLTGEVGLRWVHTRSGVAGYQSVPSQGELAPLRVAADTVDWLPTLSVRHEPSAGWVLRAAASTSITRPNFDQLSPSLTLLPNSIDPRLNQGAAGNPALQPIRARNLDLAVERYLDVHTAVHGTLFWKRVDGFVTTLSSPEEHDGQIYQVSRPRNSARAHLAGLELGYQQFFKQLPAPWQGLGLQANLSHLTSRSEPDAQGQRLPLQNLSRHSANLIGLYESAPWSARIAWNWRDRYLSGASNVVGIGTLPIYTAGYAWLDASARLQLSPRVSVSLEGLNLLQTRRRAYYGVPSRPQGVWLNDRQFGINLTVRL